MQTLAQLRSGALSGATSLKLSEGLTYFPEEIFQLAETLEVLDLSRNNLKELPKDFGRLKKLRILFCSDNLFTVMPEVLADCRVLDMVGFKANKIETVPARSVNPNLRWLILTNNCIKNLPAEIGDCTRMQKLALAGNQLTELPEALSKCRNLGLLRISANRLTELPEWLLSMPKLSWLAFSGNPFCIEPVIAEVPVIDWHLLEIHQMLGEGASGIISKATLSTNTGEKEVAVKVFKGAVTSDGLPEDEMNTFITAGLHHGLVQLIGQISGHPDGKKGLVMELIPDSFYNLGLPPSFASCTRDVFEEGSALSIKQVLKITTTIASVACKLHSKGIMHGDMYAHNTLIDDEGNTLFGDFGAACFYDKSNTEVAHALERLEVSAFGCLLDDLLPLCTETDSDVLSRIGELRDACMATNVAIRPDFQSIEKELSAHSV
ncbi:protein kinase [Flavipsychrobacter stenotrophus]|uniref:Protein kinase n=1 Tax=Flavipsychrobacter stenotrophus TaxID=2077091 RepID=A0A2S7T2G9_9BACT|nr:leucine-rich repeat-containing protein kinase family protein [Flavipsychrobacter stenotrophus]PQJ12956.1 protein kinase [Flavipsychrobacter stenotrophus]